MQVDPSETLADVRKKLLQKGYRPDPYMKFMAKGVHLKEGIPIGDQIPKGGLVTWVKTLLNGNRNGK